MNWEKILILYFGFYFITFPLTFFLLKSIVAETLDFLFNRQTVNNLLKRVDQISMDEIEKNVAIYTEKINTLKTKIENNESEETKAYWSKVLNLNASERYIAREQKLRNLFYPNENAIH